MKYLILFTALLILSCKTKKEQVEEAVEETISVAGEEIDSLFVTLKRTPCFGKCPVYTVSIYNKGFVRFISKKDVEPLGSNTTVLRKEQIDFLKQQIEEIKYFSFQDEYDKQITDIPSAITSVNYKGQKKTILNRAGAPLELTKFQNNIDKLFTNVKWVREYNY